MTKRCLVIWLLERPSAPPHRRLRLANGALGVGRPMALRPRPRVVANFLATVASKPRIRGQHDSMGAALLLCKI